MIMPKVSVIIPVYNVGPYIERCLHSLFGQTLDDIEYIFVDDGSTDDSVMLIEHVLEEYPDRLQQTKILRHDKNRGVAAARTTGIRAATGEYIIHCDPDDWVERDMYEKMYARAIETDADIVACYHMLNDRLVAYDFADTPQKCLESMTIKSRQYVHLWTKLVRRSIVEEHDIVPFEGVDFGEDLNTTVRLLYWARTISVVEEPLYHYCIHANSISTSDSYLRNFKIRAVNVEKICAFLLQTGDRRYETLSNYLKFSLKFEFRTCFSDDREWFDWYRECHKEVMKFKDNSLKSRITLRLTLSNYHIYKMARRFVRNF